MIVENLVVALLFPLVLVSYYHFIKPKDFHRWWFGMIDGLHSLQLFMFSASLAAIGFLYVMWYMIFGLDVIDTKLTTELSLIFLSTLSWAPLTYLSMFYSVHFKYLVVVALGVTSGSSFAFIYFLSTRHDDSLERNLAVAAMSLFTFHVTFVDFIGWNYFYLRKLE